MAIGWMTILSSVPWSDVIKNAPAVADGARKFWQKLRNKNPTVASGEDPVTPEKQLAVLQQRVDEMYAQLQNAGELIQSLAEQNAQLIARVEKTRRRLLLLACANLVIAVFAFAAWLR